MFYFSENLFPETTYYYAESNKLTDKNYIDWKKKNLFIVLTVENYKYILTQSCPPVPAKDVHRNQRRFYEKWQKANEMTKCYILASISNIL